MDKYDEVAQRLDNEGIISFEEDIIRTAAILREAFPQAEASGELTVEAVNAGLAVGLEYDNAPETAKAIYRQNPFAYRIAHTILAARPAPAAEKALRERIEQYKFCDGCPARSDLLAHEAPEPRP